MLQHRFSIGSLLLVALCLAPVAPVHAAKDSPFIISKKDFKKQVKSVALTPLVVPDLLILTDEMRALIESEAARRLAKTRLDVTGIEPYAEIQTLFAAQIGGLLDASGKPDARRRDIVSDHARREMRLRYPVDAFAEISLRVVNADFADDRANWDGVKQKVKKSGDGFALFGGKDYRGEIAAVSFQLAFFNRANELLFVERGGIEVLQERQSASLVLLPLDTVLLDEKRLKKAVQIAFKPM